MLQFTEEEIRDMFKLLSGVLQLGNIEFMTAGGAQITTKQGRFACSAKPRNVKAKTNVFSASLSIFQCSVMPASCWAWTPSSCLKS